MAVRIPKPLKERMRRLRRKVDWPSEMRKFLEERARRAETEEHMKAVVTLLQETAHVFKRVGETSVREDRDRG